MEDSDNERIYDHDSESDIQDKKPTEATDDGIATSKTQNVTNNTINQPSQDHDNDSLLAEEEINPVVVGISASMSDTELISIEEPQKRPVLNYSRSLCIPYTENDNDTLVIEGAETATSLDFTGTIEKDKNNLGHIMISYNSSTKNICSRIAKYLKNHSYMVWIDQDNISGDVFTSMAAAIENSFVVLMAINEKYYQSRYCRLEAEYAVERNKASIPMLMQSGYKPLGWLGIINGSKYHIDFSALPFDEAFNLLLREIEAVRVSLGAEAHVQNVTMPVNNQITTNSMGSWIYLQNVPEWTEHDVTQWLYREKLEIFENGLTRFTGATLWQMYKVKLESPTDYHRMIESLLPLTVPSRLFLILSFNSALESLFSTSMHR